jgi:hypothetical protein
VWEPNREIDNDEIKEKKNGITRVNAEPKLWRQFSVSSIWSPVQGTNDAVGFLTDGLAGHTFVMHAIK